MKKILFLIAALAATVVGQAQVVPVTRGGTGATTASGARTNLGAGDMLIATYDADANDLPDDADIGPTLQAALAAKGDVATRLNVITPTALTASVNDYAPTGIATARMVVLTSDAAYDITGLLADTSGEPVVLVNANAAFALTLKGESTSTVTAANRFSGTDYLLPAGSSVVAHYVAAESRWALPGSTEINGTLEVDANGQVGTKLVTKTTATDYTVGTTDPAELKGGVIYVTGAATITIPARAAGYHFTVITVGAVAVSVDPNAADLIMLDGVALADGDKITNTSTSGDIAVITDYDATGFYAATDGWTDTN